jgi:hypothetical protein
MDDVVQYEIVEYEQYDFVKHTDYEKRRRFKGRFVRENYSLPVMRGPKLVSFTPAKANFHLR